MMEGWSRDDGEGWRSGAVRWMILLVWAFGLALIAALWLVVGEQARFERKEAIATGVRQNVNRAIAFEQYVIRTIEAADAITLHIADKYPGLENLPRELDPPKISATTLAAISIADADGDIVASTIRPTPTMSLSDRTGFKVHQQSNSGRLYVGKPIRSVAAAGNYIGLSRRIDHRDGSFAGVIVAQIAPSQFTDFYRQAEIEPNDLIAVIGLDGIIRARRTGATSSFGEDLSKAEVMRRQRTKPVDTYLNRSAIDGVRRYFSYRRLADYPLMIVVGVAQADLLAPIDARTRNYRAGAMLTSLLILGFCWLIGQAIRRRQVHAARIGDAHKRLSEAQQIGKIGDWTYDLASGRMKWSDQLYAMYERDPERGPPPLSEFLGWQDLPGRIATQRAIDRAIATGEPQTCEFAAMLPSGAVSHRRSVTVPMRDASGRVTGLHGTDQDNNGQKMLDQLRQQVAHLSRLDAMSTMAATLAHELNQPLTAAANFLSGSRRLAARRREESNVGEGIREAEQQISHAANIIRRIRDMVANRPARYDPIQLADAVGDALALIGTAHQFPGVRVQAVLDPLLEPVAADAVQVQQVLINLVRNACDAVARVDDPIVRIEAIRFGDDVRVSVVDNGPGIPKSVKDLFYPFRTSKETGLGLGLSISRTIVEAHGGRIWVERTGPDGTELCFTLPLAGERRRTNVHARA